MKNRERAVIIIGGNHHNTLGVVRALGAKIDRDLIYLIYDTIDSFVVKSRYLKKSNCFYVSTDSAISSVIGNIASGYKQKPIVICCSDKYIKEIDEHSRHLSQVAVLPRAESYGTIAQYLEKDKQRELSIRVGLIPPKSFDIESIKHNNTFPCIIKPENSTKGKKSDIHVCFSQAELESCFQKYDSSEIRIEQYIDKESEFQLIGCSLSQTIIIPGYTDIIRQPKTTNTGYLKYKPIQDGFISTDLISKVKNFIREIGYLGLFSMEFIRGKDGIDYFLEINMRNDGNAYCVTCAGVNLPFIWYMYSDSSDAKIDEKISFSRPVLWMPEADIKNARKVGILKWTSEWCKSDGHGIYNHRDPFPMIYSLYLRVKNKIFST